MVSLIDDIRYTETRLVDMFKFLERTEGSPTHEMQLLLRSYIHLVSSFLVATLELEFVLACTSHFDKETRRIKGDDGNVIIRLDAKTIDKIFEVSTTLV